MAGAPTYEELVRALLEQHSDPQTAFRRPMPEPTGPFPTLDKLPPRQVIENDYSRAAPQRVQREVAENISPTMGAYGLGQLLADTYGKGAEGDLGGVASNAPLLAAAFAGVGRLPKGFRIERSGSRDAPYLSYNVINPRGNEVGEAVVRNSGRLGMENVYLEGPYRRQGIGTALYGHIEKDLGKQFAPANMLTDQAHAFWMKHNPEAVRRYLRLNSDDHFAWRAPSP